MDFLNMAKWCVSMWITNSRFTDPNYLLNVKQMFYVIIRRYHK